MRIKNKIKSANINIKFMNFLLFKYNYYNNRYTF